MQGVLAALGCDARFVLASRTDLVASIAAAYTAPAAGAIRLATPAGIEPPTVAEAAPVGEETMPTVAPIAPIAPIGELELAPVAPVETEEQAPTEQVELAPLRPRRSRTIAPVEPPVAPVEAAADRGSRRAFETVARSRPLRRSRSRSRSRRSAPIAGRARSVETEPVAPVTEHHDRAG